MTSRLRALPGLLALLSGLCLLVPLADMWATRVQYPFDLEWMEGGMLSHSWRLMAGSAIYVEPSAEFIPFVYPPGYASLVALLGGVFGLDYPLARLVSIVGTLASATALGTLLWRHARDPVAAMSAAALFLGTWPHSGAFFDIARPDGLFMGLLGWSIVAAFERQRGAPEAAGLLLAAAFITKHNAAVFGVPLALAVLVRSGRVPATRFVLASAVPGALLTLYMQWVSGGHFLVYLLEVPASHPTDFARIWPELPRELGTALAIALFATSLWCLHCTFDRWTRIDPVGVPLVVACGVAAGFANHLHTDGQYAFPTSPTSTGLAAFALGVVGACGVLVALAQLAPRAPRLSWELTSAAALAVTALISVSLMRQHNGGYLNVLMPLHWAIVACFGMAVADMRRAGLLPEILATGAILVQVGWMVGAMSVDRLVPSREDAVVGTRFVEALSARPGPVFSPYAAWLPVQAGKAPSMHLISLWDLNFPDGPYFAHVAEIEAQVRGHRWPVAVGGTLELGYGLEQAYRVDARPPSTAEAFMPRTGWQVKPATILVPR